MIQRHGPEFARDLLNGDRLRPVPTSGHHDAENTLVDQVRTGGPQARSEQSVRGRGRSAPLDIAKYRYPRFQVGKLFELSRQAQGIP